MQLLAPRARDKWARKLQALPLTNDSEAHARVFKELQLLRHFAAVVEQLKAGCNAADANEREAGLTGLLQAAFDARLTGPELREVKTPQPLTASINSKKTFNHHRKWTFTIQALQLRPGQNLDVSLSWPL